MNRRRWYVSIAACFLLWGAQPAQAAGLDPVITGPAYQSWGSSNGTMVAWSQNEEDSPLRFIAYGAPLDGIGSPTRLNAPDTRGYTGGFDPGTNTVIYQQTSDGRRSNIFLYDLDTDERMKLPPTVNTDRWEYRPRISTAFVLFIRTGRTGDRLLLWDRFDDSLTELDSSTFGRTSVAAGTVGERYVTWTRCTRRTCLALYHDTTTGETTRVPAPDRRVHYAPTIDEPSGQIYYVRSGNPCGANVRILRAPLADVSSTTLLASLPDGVDTTYTQSLAPSATVEGELDLWISRYNCRSEDSDVYALRGVHGSSAVDVSRGSARSRDAQPVDHSEYSARWWRPSIDAAPATWRP